MAFIKLPKGPLTGLTSLAGYAANTVFWFVPLSFMATLKLMVPVKKWRTLCDRALSGMANSWIYINNINIGITSRVKWDVSGLDSLGLNQWYLVVANHQSWVDILVLQKVFFRKIPFLKFFLKKSLIWVPLLGVCWWALDFPFMKRYSKAKLAKKPHLKGKDLETTQKACEKFKNIPVAVMNFVEGTRFTPEKHERQGSPYQGLLRPKSGGIAFVLGAMGDKLSHIVNVTISYPQGPKSFWHFVSGKIEQIKVRVESLPINNEMLGDYFGDAEYREHFQKWLNQLWDEKDRQLANLLALPAPEPVADK